MQSDYFGNRKLQRRIILLLLSVCLTGCAASRTVYDVPRKITGVVMLTGNEPFTQLAIRTSDDTVYAVNCSEEVEKLLLANQGRIVEVFYVQIENKMPVDEIKVVRAVIRSN